MQEGGPRSDADGLSDEALRSAMELAVDVAASGSKLRPPLAFPAGLRPLLRQKRLTTAQIGRARQAVEDDAAFRAHVADVATADLVDEVGLVWLRRPPGWEARLAELVAETAAPDATAAARREHRRRAAAQEAAERERSEHATTRERWAKEHDRRVELQARLAQAERQRDEAVESAAQARAEADRLRAELGAARADAAAARERAGAALERAVDAEAARDEVLAARAGEPLAFPDARSGPIDLADVRRAHAAATDALDHAQAVAREVGRALAEAATAQRETWPPPGVPAPRRRAEGPRRTPVQIPGGLYAKSAAVTEHLLRLPGIVVLVDGYNVAKLGWPALALDVQRERLVTIAEDVARRWGTDVTIVFDGADVTGASAAHRRLVRVVFSPAGVSADDVLRAEVGALDHRRAVVVVTSDQAVVNDVRAAGANTVASDQFLAVARR